MVKETRMNWSEAEIHSTKENNINRGMKQTEIGLIPEDWEFEKLGDFAQIFTGTTPPTNNIKNYGDEYLFVSPADLGKRKFILNTEKKLSKIGFSVARKYPANSVLFTCIGSTIGKSGISKIELSSNQQINAVLPNDFYSSDFLYYFLNLISPKIKLGASEQAVPMINKTEFSKIQIPLPPLAEQEAIATALSDCDSWIDSIEEVLAKKRLIKQGAMQELLTPPSTGSGTAADGEPVEPWEVKKLGTIADIVGGGTPSTYISNYWNGHIEWFTPTEVGYAKYLYSSKRKISDLGFKNSSANILPINTILLTSRAGIGDLGILKVEASTNQGFQSIICKETVNVEFIYYLMSTKKEELLKNASGSTFLEISPNKVKSLELSIPSLSEQTRIATILSDMDLEIEALEEKLHKARQIKQGMMQELLTGRVRLV